VLKKGFEMAAELGAKKKAIIFTESRITQDFLLRLLSENGYENKIVLFNGSNNDDKSKAIYEAWFRKHRDTDKITGSKTADKRAAIIDYFKDEADIMIATEAGAEGVNLQFCSLLINYDLPWNPQRIEQRIGRCHRYGQKYDVVVINFVNRKNAADQRVYELLDEKFSLFKGVFGASDEILGSIESGVDFEKRIAAIYQSCRTEDEINTAFDALQNEMDESITSSLKDTRQKLLENFDSEVHEKLKVNIRESQSYLDRYERWLWDITRFYLGDNADFAEHEYSFMLKSNPFSNEDIHRGPYRIGKNIEDAHIYRPGHPLAQRIIEQCKHTPTLNTKMTFHYSDDAKKISILDGLVGKSGWLMVKFLTITSLESEDHVLLFGMTDDGKILEEEQCQRMFSVSADKSDSHDQNGLNTAVPKMNSFYKERKQDILAQMSARDGRYFETELDKMDNWAEDKRKGLKAELKEYDDQIAVLKKEARLAANLPDKLAIQKKLRDIDKKRDTAWKEYDEAAKKIEKQKDELLDTVEERLMQTIEEKTLFTIRWSIE